METPTSGLNRACVLSYGDSGGEAFVSIAYRSCELGWFCLDIEKSPPLAAGCRCESKSRAG